MSATAAATPSSTGDAESLPLPPPRFYVADNLTKKTSWQLPHWHQDECSCFVTWRTADSLPQDKLERLHVEREEWEMTHRRFMAMYRGRTFADADARRGKDSAAPVVEAHGCRRGKDSAAPVGKARELSSGGKMFSAGEAESLPLREEEYLQQLSEYRELHEGRLQKWLDAGSGACVLADADNRRIVENAIMHFNGTRYVVYAYVVMPNHVHVLFMPFGEFRISDILASWKRFTARQLNAVAGISGAFWQKESWDHLVRNERQFTKYLSYIRANDGDKAYDAYAAMRGQAEAGVES